MNAASGPPGKTPSDGGKDGAFDAYAGALAAAHAAAAAACQKEREAQAELKEVEGQIHATTADLQKAVAAWKVLLGHCARPAGWAPLAKWQEDARALCQVASEDACTDEFERIAALRRRTEEALAGLKKVENLLERQIVERRKEEQQAVAACDLARSAVAGARQSIAAETSAAGQSALEYGGVCAVVGGLGGGCYGCAANGATFIGGGVVGAFALGFLGFFARLLLGDPGGFEGQRALQRALEEERSQQACVDHWSRQVHELEQQRAAWLGQPVGPPPVPMLPASGPRPDATRFGAVPVQLSSDSYPLGWIFGSLGGVVAVVLLIIGFSRDPEPVRLSAPPVSPASLPRPADSPNDRGAACIPWRPDCNGSGNSVPSAPRQLAPSPPAEHHHGVSHRHKKHHKKHHKKRH